MATPITNIHIYLSGHSHELLATATKGLLLDAPGHTSQVLIQHPDIKGGEKLEADKSYIIKAKEIAAIEHAVLDILPAPFFEDGTIYMFTETGKTKID